MQKFSETHNLEELMLIESPNKTVCISSVRDIDWNRQHKVVSEVDEQW